MKTYIQLTKFGIGLSVVFVGLIGYTLSFSPDQGFSVMHLLTTLVGMYLLSTGSLALNQVQEKKQDSQMERTADRPVASGEMSSLPVILFSWGGIIWGLGFLWMSSPTASLIGLLSVIFYNGFYTLWWKKKMAFGAVPGAIPGALPVVIGYAANSSNVFTAECLYVFLILFLWQMPHFWTLAIRLKDDYARGGFPVLPTALGVEKTLYHIGLYVFVYVGLALFSPWFVSANWFYAFLVIPFALMVLFEFFGFFLSKAQRRFMPFFMWTNVSMLIFLIAPVVDKWNF